MEHVDIGPIVVCRSQLTLKLSPAIAAGGKKVVDEFRKIDMIAERARILLAHAVGAVDCMNFKPRKPIHQIDVQFNGALAGADDGNGGQCGRELLYSRKVVAHVENSRAEVRYERGRDVPAASRGEDKGIRGEHPHVRFYAPLQGGMIDSHAQRGRTVAHHVTEMTRDPFDILGIVLTKRIDDA